MSSDRIRVGVVGVGAIGVWHVQTYKGDANCELVALCDRDAKWLEHAQREYDVKLGFSTFEELVACEEIDAVSVCLPTVFHAPVTVAALRHGKHVLCEKPMAANAPQAREMAAAAREAGKALMIGYNQRLGGDIQYLKRYIDEGNLGEVYFARTGWRRAMGALPPSTAHRATGSYNRNWFNEKAMAGGVTTDLGSHVVDLAMYLMGFPKVKQVVGCAYTKFGPQSAASQGTTFDADDHSVGFAKFENGASMMIEASFGCYVEKDTVFQAIYGDQGGAHRESGEPLKLFSRAAGSFATVIPRLDLPSTTPMNHFIECLVHEKTPIITPEEGVAVTEILDGIYASSEADTQ